jgi:hypothetical protein
LFTVSCADPAGDLLSAGEKLKRCGKSAPAQWQHCGLVNPIWSKGK